MTGLEQRLSDLEGMLQVARDQNDLRQEADLLTEMAGIYLAQEQYEQALHALERCRARYEALEDRAGEAKTLNNIGVLYQERDAFDEALRWFNATLTIWHELGDEAAEATTAFNTATVCYQLGNLEEAERLLERATKLHVKLNHPEQFNDRSALEQVRTEIAARQRKE